MKRNSPTTRSQLLAALIAAAAFLPGQPAARAADHGDAPTLAHDQGADIADVYLFRDPNDTVDSNVVLIATFRGFIVPGEASNFGIFDPALKYRFEIYNKHVNQTPPLPDDKPAVAKFLKDAKPNKFIDVTFSQRTADPGPILSGTIDKTILQVPKAQTATIKFTGFTGINAATGFTADATNPSLSGTAPAPTVTDLPIPGLAGSGVKFFAGERDDPFFFDIPGLSRFIASVRTTGTADFTQLARARDTFAGYNVMSIALRLPTTLLTGTGGSKIGVDFLTQRHNVEKPTKLGEIKGTGGFKTVDRLGNPAVNVVLVPFDRKNEYNPGTPIDDIKGKFAGDIVDTLTALGTDSAHIGILAGVAVAHGDLLTLDTAIANNLGDKKGGGDPTIQASFNVGFPNGRRLRDDVVDILLTLITNGNLTLPLTGGDGVNANDVPLTDTFPFLAPSQQPLGTGVTDDNTRN